jgi:hypothetical protein
MFPPSTEKRSDGCSVTLRHYFGGTFAEVPRDLLGARLFVQARLIPGLRRLVLDIYYGRVEGIARSIPYAVKAANFSKYHVSILWLACEARLVFPCLMLAAFK